MPTFDLIIQNNLGTQIDRMDDISCPEIPVKGDVFTWTKVDWDGPWTTKEPDKSYIVLYREWRLMNSGKPVCLVFVTPKETA